MFRQGAKSTDEVFYQPLRKQAQVKLQVKLLAIFWIFFYFYLIPNRTVFAPRLFFLHYVLSLTRPARRCTMGAILY
ncbi:MAG: hypothetical protein LBT89_03945, partial [Planctomycetaceae bacterium]|nr:hypothetical protein [Planctomycetaceae bacterium]